MGKSKEVHTAVLLPWLKLGDDLDIGNYRFLRWPRNDEDFSEFAESLNSICGMYKYLDGSIESPQTIVLDKTRAPFERLEGQERQTFREAVLLLTVALIGENDYFTNIGNYVNFSSTELHFQNFSVGEDWVAFTSLRRDGSTSDMGYQFRDITISTPPGCRTRTGCNKFTKGWLGTLGTVLEKNKSLDRLVLEASDLFCQANTDSPNVLQTTEIVTLANAFDRLFPSSNGRFQLSEEISQKLTRWVNIKLDRSNRFTSKGIVPSDINGNCSNEWDLVRYWAFELYLLRNDYVHGNDLTLHDWVWNPSEHLLMGAYVFPLLLKVLMEEDKRYELSDDDQYKLFAIDDLLDLNEYYDKESRINLWRKTLLEVRQNTRN